MATPTSINVTGQFLKVDGTPESGSVIFQSRGYVLQSSGSSAIVPSRVTGHLDSLGVLDMDVLATNDPQWAPSGWQYTLVLKLSQDYSVYQVSVPYDAVGGQISLAELIPTASSQPISPANYAPLVHTHAASAIVSGTIASARLPIGTTSGTVAAGDHSHGGSGGPIEISDVTGLTTALDGKAATAHSHAQSDVTGLVTALSGKASTVHTHSISDVTGLQTSLDTKVNSASLATVATSGSYNDLLDRPTIPTVPVTSVSGKTGAVTLVSADVGLGNVNNTSDANKPISTATQAALDTKASNTSVTDVSNRVTAVEAMTPVVMLWNGTSYVEADSARIYVGPSDPGAVADGSVWIDTTP